VPMPAPPKTVPAGNTCSYQSDVVFGPEAGVPLSAAGTSPAVGDRGGEVPDVPGPARLGDDQLAGHGVRGPVAIAAAVRAVGEVGGGGHARGAGAADAASTASPRVPATAATATAALVRAAINHWHKVIGYQMVGL
jgi:hypothetical protein